MLRLWLLDESSDEEAGGGNMAVDDSGGDIDGRGPSRLMDLAMTMNLEADN